MALRLVLAIVGVLLAGGLAQAERRVALVFGSNDYLSLRLLANAVNDARAVRDALEELGFEVAMEPNRDLARMRRALDDFREDAAGADVALVFFAGHGVEIAGENRLLPVDADASSLERLAQSSLPLEEVSRAIVDSAAIGLLILDACRTNPFGGAAGGRGAQAIAPAVRAAVRPGLGRLGRADNLLVAFSAAPGQAAEDGPAGNSPFTASLLRHIARPGLEIRSVLTLVQQDVYDLTRGRQIPYVESGLPRAFFTADDGAPVAERERLLLAMADLTPDIRGQVEKVASDADVPLAPLYGALIGAGQQPSSVERRDAMLKEAAESYARVRDAMLTLGAADPEVASLRQQASEQLALGAFEAARARLSEAAAVDRNSRDRLKANYAERTLSEAATRYLGAGVARADLNYALAISELEAMEALFAEVDRGDIPAEHADRRLQALLTLGDLYRTIGNIGASATTYEHLQTLAEKRQSRAPADMSILRDRGIVAMKLGRAQLTLGRVGAAIEQFERAQAMLGEAASAPGAPSEWLRDFARIADDIGNVHMLRGESPAAYEAYGGGLTIKQRLAAQQPDDLGLQRDLTVSYDEIGDLLRVAGRWQQARRTYEEGLRIRLAIARAAPDDPGAQRDLSVSYDKIGDTLRDATDFDGALQAYGKSREIAEAQLRRDTGNTDLRRDASISISKIGNVLRDRKDFSGALKAYLDALEQARELARLDPDNTDWQRDLSVSIEKVADMLNKQGDPRGALDAYASSYEIMDRLVGLDPANADWQRDLSITLAEIGNLQVRGKDADGARATLKRSLDIREALAAGQPGSALAQRDLVIAYADYARVAPNAREILTRALAIARALDAADRMAPAHRALIAYIETRLGALN
ncbi:MAG: caspase family protein [Rhizobiaceae bacterium]|nr:caspase family protein [Rhizobiaceae bacterium]